MIVEYLKDMSHFFHIFSLLIYLNLLGEHNSSDFQINNKINTSSSLSVWAAVIKYHRLSDLKKILISQFWQLVSLKSSGGRFDVCWGSTSLFPDGLILAVSSNGGVWESKLSGLCMKTLPSWPNLPPKGTISKYHHIGVKASTWIFKGYSPIHSIVLKDSYP